MSLWVDKYRPKALDKLDFHEKVTDRLSKLASASDLPHLCFYGPSGAGKKTRIIALLRELYGVKAEKLSIQQRQFQTASNTKFQVHVVSSSVHIEVTPSDVGNNDRIVVQELIKEMAQTQQIDSKASRKFKIVVIHEADQLSKDAQHGLRRTMEKYSGNLRLIMCANSVGRIIPPIRSRCLLIRVGAPTEDEIIGVLQKVGSKEHVSVPREVALDISRKSERNLRQALLILEAANVQAGGLDVGMTIPLSDWEVYLKEVAAGIMQEQSPARLLQIRTKIYELLAHCIPAELILQKLAYDLIERVNDNVRPLLVAEAAFYEHRIRLGNKAIYHLEAFIAKFMSILKRDMLGQPLV
eukprot:Partr_v1_DN24496_c0_g1_i2_m66518 putative replication factor c